jgi:hypothetical protein
MAAKQRPNALPLPSKQDHRFSATPSAPTAEVQDCKRLVDVAAGDLGAGGHDVAYAPLVLLDVELYHAVLARELEDLLQVDLPDVLDVDRPALGTRQTDLTNEQLGAGTPRP